MNITTTHNYMGITTFRIMFTNKIHIHDLYHKILSQSINMTKRDRWGDPDVDGRIILRRIFRKWEGVVGTGWSWFRIGTSGGHL
jgi:hypothetical protein